MTSRFGYAKLVPDLMEALLGVGSRVEASGLEPTLVELVYLRVSQINGCAFCLEMHTGKLRALGEKQQRLDLLAAWREAPVYSERERAALAWAEELTLVADTHASDEAYAAARTELDEREISALTFAVAYMNAWNRISIAARNMPKPRRAD